MRNHCYASPNHIGCGVVPGPRGMAKEGFTAVAHNQPFVSTDPNAANTLEPGGTSTNGLAENDILLRGNYIASPDGETNLSRRQKKVADDYSAELSRQRDRATTTPARWFSSRVHRFGRQAPQQASTSSEGAEGIASDKRMVGSLKGRLSRRKLHTIDDLSMVNPAEYWKFESFAQKQDEIGTFALYYLSFLMIFVLSMVWWLPVAGRDDDDDDAAKLAELPVYHSIDKEYVSTQKFAPAPPESSRH
ncbi:hypothetical protein FOL47_001957 [Perkinsus chesapeaki]|uniref:Uncharacterized protein n=1 Tax=Perkinsus chesapeaki TaxID=330153 RepID=A0A7J6N359_PERCH|nr:hypothetical protein FOL47_001957 [Perkinsus chesapeaki]